MILLIYTDGSGNQIRKLVVSGFTGFFVCNLLSLCLHIFRMWYVRNWHIKNINRCWIFVLIGKYIMLLSFIYSRLPLFPETGEFLHVFFTLVCTRVFWLLILLVAVTATLPDITFAAIKHSMNHVVGDPKKLKNVKTWFTFEKSTSFWLTNIWNIL